ncbi:hypothetical protein SAMN05216548_108206 [Faunimonas pinastri]|uniref:Uncharacterized protein n=1 Tax=Faunimonas pinastri TaxID=1855383 RepID=A0A1H9JPK8_9HYPH|nr:hypothetical protein [Faunimonas pinastri]SEQ88737.1 hypothetical protein SAMN05216548_108206 [Faunimonas pinastri]
MIEAPPIFIEASPDDLRSLHDSLTGYCLAKADLPESYPELVWGLWLLRGSMPPLLVTVVEHDIAFKFEVFTLRLKTQEQMLSSALIHPSRQRLMTGGFELTCP